MNTHIARQLLSNMPDELFDLYMESLIQEHGFPFSSPDSPTNLPWWQLFDCHSFKTICDLSWERHEIAFSLAVFHPLSQQQIQGLLQTHILGVKTVFADIPNTEARFRRARGYIASARRMPVPVVLMDSIGGLRILDGNHRLAAMASFADAESGIIDAWIGSLYGF